MVDSLALMDLFQTVDNNVTQATIEQIFSVSSNQRGSGFIASSGIAEGNSLENALDALRKVFLGNVEPTRFGRQTGDFGQPEFRNQFYANLEQVKGQVIPNGAQIVSLVGMLPQDVSNQAEAEIAYRYALRELNPFVVLGADYDRHNTDGELDRFNSVDGTGTLTHEYLIDRALFLAKKIDLNLANSEAGVTGIHYQDAMSGYEIAPILAGAEVIFGGDSSEVVLGKDDDDRLYGGGGHDVLQGLSGDDYLEGGQGNDILSGGEDDDLLKGGAGFDTYIYNTGDGTDRIEDFWGTNAVLFDQKLLQAGIHKNGDATNTYTSADGTLIFVLANGDLIVNDTLILNENFQSGDFGIRLIDEASYANGLSDLPFTFGDTDDVFVSGGQAGNLVVNLGAGNDTAFAGTNNDQLFGGAGNDTLFGNSADDRLYGGLGNDFLAGDNDAADVTQGNDHLDGGDGDDTLNGGWGNDLLYGGLGSDVLYGDTTGRAQGTYTADDYLDGGDGDDELHGLAGHDVLYGGANNDVLSGEEGDDVADGGAGDDLLLAHLGNDTLAGGTGIDRLYGDEGDDVLDGGSENDHLYGGDGVDVLH
ncbi:MAG: calcium-binding protein, partial [Nitrospiraceae bacterium]